MFGNFFNNFLIFFDLAGLKLKKGISIFEFCEAKFTITVFDK
jgi:hypothetical protein